VLGEQADSALFTEALEQIATLADAVERLTQEKAGAVFKMENAHTSVQAMDSRLAAEVIKNDKLEQQLAALSSKQGQRDLLDRVKEAFDLGYRAHWLVQGGGLPDVEAVDFAFSKSKLATLADPPASAELEYKPLVLTPALRDRLQTMAEDYFFSVEERQALTQILDQFGIDGSAK
jgi:hypothetical protein